MTLQVDRAGQPVGQERARLSEEIARSRLVYSGGLGSPQIAHKLNVPHILVLEYDLQTQLTVTTSQVSSLARRAIRTVRCTWAYMTAGVPEMRRAYAIHCNGYPIYDAAQSHNANRLLYLDSRMTLDMIIARAELTARLATRAGRPLRLLFSGRYERMKGVDDAVRVAAECLRRGLDIEMHFYGQGNLRAQMEQIAAQSARPERIRIHDAIPYPELVMISRTFDLFVCCHIQSDPSCTYLESFGAALPIVGYANKMWRRLSEASGGGLSSPIGRPERVADDVQRLASDFATLTDMSHKALEFATAHNCEREFAKRTDAINAAIAEVGTRRQGPEIR